MRVVGSFANKFDLSHFPIDRQELSIRLRSHHPAHTLHLCQPRDQVKYMSICRRDNFVHDDEWHMASELVAYESRSHPTDTLNVPAKVYAEYQFRVKVARKWHVYVWDILMPLWLLSVFSTSSLIVPRSSLGERIAIPLAMILASLTFRNSFIERIPVVSYMTTLDKIILLNFLLFGALLVADVAFVFFDAGGDWLDDGVEIADAKIGISPQLEFYLACGFLSFQGFELLFLFLLLLMASRANERWLHEQKYHEALTKGVSKWRRQAKRRSQGGAQKHMSFRRLAQRCSSHASKISVSPSCEDLPQGTQSKRSRVAMGT